ncbi:unnamed protein product [Paramecium pentaurelia]|uniref:Cyclic nucleotide-binding domain-containing protein n=1 Tax=Paramecium pentaurelia TaxID=43138 RepID=A0A8S1XMY4_9CILI|nr:unnamed protein product [Paramecium pentaurelia]
MEEQVTRPGKKLWAIARKKVKVIARINAMKRITLQNYYGVRDDNDFVEATQINKWVIYPDSKFKGCWDFIIILLMLYTCTILPFRLAFQDSTSDVWNTIDEVFNYVFMADIVINFFTAYQDADNVLVTNNKYIVMNYLKSWFLLDVASVIPFDQIFQPDPQTETATTQGQKGSYTQLLRLTRLPRLYRLLKVVKLFRIVRFQQTNRSSMFSKLIKSCIKLDASIKRMIKIMGMSLLFLHLSSCFYYLITKIETDTVTWVTNLGLEEADEATLYIRSFHWALQTLTTVGFGDVSPQTDWEKLYAIFWMGVGSAFFSFMISNLQGAVGDSEKSAKNKIMRLNVIQNKIKIPDYLFGLIKRQLESQQIENSRQQIILQTKPLIKQLPTCLRSSVQLCIYAHVIEKIKFLQDKDIELIMDVIPKISPLNWAQGDILFSTDDYAEEIYFVSIGEITTRAADGSTISVYREGDTLGLLEAIYDVRRIGTAICSKNTQLFSLDRTTYLQMLQDYPQLLSEVKQQVDKRIKEVKPFVEDATILNRSIYEVMQDYQRKINKIKKIIEQLQKSEDSNDIIDTDKNQLQIFLQTNTQLGDIMNLQRESNSRETVMFENAKSMNNLIDQLADLWQKQLIEKIDQMHTETTYMIQAVQDRVEYYQKATKKFSNLKNDLTKQKENIQSMTKI